MCQRVHTITVHTLLMFFCLFLCILWLRFVLCLEKQAKWKATSSVLWPRCHPSGPLQKSHQCHCQDASRALLSVNPSVTSSAVDACHSFNLSLPFLLLLLLHAWDISIHSAFISVLVFPSQLSACRNTHCKLLHNRENCLHRGRNVLFSILLSPL